MAATAKRRSTDSAQTMRRTRAETLAAMLDAAEALFAERGYEAVSVREIAARAQVSHALVHRYLGSKAQIYGAVLQRNEGPLAAVAAASDDLFVAASLLLREGLGRHRAYLRIAAASALAGMPYETTVERSPAARRALELADEAARRNGVSDALQVRLAVAGAFALLLGWAAAESWLLPATELQGTDEATVLAGLERAIHALLADGIAAPA